MTIYNVHINREMRLYFPGIDAASAEEAARIAADKLTDDAKYVEDCDGANLAALVDLAGDDEFTQSVTIDFEPEQQRKAAPKMLEALKACELQLREHVKWHHTHAGGCSVEMESAWEQSCAAIASATTTQQGRNPPLTPTNQERALRCRTAMAGYSGDDDLRTSLVDFLADAMHLCDQADLSFEDILDSARMHFDAEVNGDDILDDFTNQATNERSTP